ncbi:probable receptor-like protein kinase At1g33260 [Andrographis paniculata]|uniref:probable receptor-like protein kinase At1g33260 n=1 Tax=Andrographis paniculata TaxID=175694 RepID=UPI0021E7BCEB|nr:probable receptor-like protein kinase At1g33260 [Andrographis paniculata]XP_051144940.1 probable receptor-like protein kinase At1g33260 [Andrographis paniculata]
MGLLKFLKSKLRRKTTPAVAVVKESTTSSGKLLKFSWNHIETLTRGFSVPIGYGGFSTVYLAQIPGAGATHSTAAVKILQGCSQRLFQAYRQELEILLRVGRHDNIIKLLGYCDDREEGVLIFEYVAGGTLQDKLHHRDKAAAAPLPWRARMSIAFQVAKAMAYLHDGCTPAIVHGDIKPSNILLDDSLNCKLCDFGSAKTGFSSSVIPNSSRGAMMVVGSPGYTDPLYLKTGLASKKNDIYSFGVVILELVTGLEAVNPTRGERLVTRTRNLADVWEMVDPRIRGDVEMEEVRAMVALSRMCLCECPNIRPSARDIVDTMMSRVPSPMYSCPSKKGSTKRT